MRCVLVQETTRRQLTYKLRNATCQAGRIGSQEQPGRARLRGTRDQETHRGRRYCSTWTLRTCLDLVDKLHAHAHFSSARACRCSWGICLQKEKQHSRSCLRRSWCSDRPEVLAREAPGETTSDRTGLLTSTRLHSTGVEIHTERRHLIQNRARKARVETYSCWPCLFVAGNINSSQTRGIFGGKLETITSVPPKEWRAFPSARTALR